MKGGLDSYLERGAGKDTFANKSEFLLSGSNANRTSQAQIILIEDQYRSDQIQTLLNNSTIQQHVALNTLSSAEIQSFSVQELQDLINQRVQSIQEQFPEEKKLKLSQEFNNLKILLQEYSLKINQGMEEISKMKNILSNKIHQVEEMELANLEWQIIIDFRLKNQEDLKYLKNGKTSVESQTDIQYQSITEREQLLEFKEKEIQINEIRIKEELEQREKQILRRERDLQIRQKMIDEQRVEYTYKSKELNQRLKNSLVWPLSCLENEQKLGEKLKDIKLTPDLFKGIQLESDKNFAQFLERKENKLFLSELNGKTYMKGESLLKYEYMLLQERTKNVIVKEYTESELNVIEQEKAEAIRERERYSHLQELEKSVQEENKYLEESRTQFKKVVEDIQKCFKDLNLSQQFSKDPSNYQDRSFFNTSRFNEVLMKTQTMLKQVFSPNKIKQEDIIIPHQNEGATQRIERILTNLEKLNQIEDSPKRMEIIEKKEQNLDQIKKILKREAYFIDEEKKWINEKRQQLSKFDKSKMSKSVQESFLIENSQIKGLFSMDQSEALDEDKKQLKIQQQSLSIEMEKTYQTKDQLNEELRKTKRQNEKLFEIERQMNEQKLKLLIKLERIKMLEDFYNSYNTEEPIHLEIEIDKEELMKVVREKYEQEHIPQEIIVKPKTFQEKRRILQRSVFKLLSFLEQKKNIHDDSLQTYKFFEWKLRISEQKTQESELLKQLSTYDEQIIQRILTLPQFQMKQPLMIESKSVQAFRSLNQSEIKVKDHVSFQVMEEIEPPKTWFEGLWSKKSQQIQLNRVKSLSSEQFQSALDTFESDIQHFWKFRCTNILKLVDLHMRRRARLILAFGFMKYKEQVLKKKLALYDLDMTNQTLFYQNLEEKNLLMDGMPILEATESQGIIQQTPGINRILNKTPQSQFKPQNTDPKLRNKNMVGLNSKSQNILINESRAYSGISEIIVNQREGMSDKRERVLNMILIKRGTREFKDRLIRKSQYWNKWKGFMRDLEIFSIKAYLKNMINELENLRFSEQMLKTNFRVQKTELESKLSQLITNSMAQ